MMISCGRYNFIKSIEDETKRLNMDFSRFRLDELHRKLDIARVQCQLRCERTAYQLNEWLRKPMNQSKLH